MTKDGSDLEDFNALTSIYRIELYSSVLEIAIKEMQGAVYRGGLNGQVKTY